MSINVYTCTGRTTADIELKTTPNGKETASFSVAVENGFGDSKHTIFTRWVAWGGQAKYAANITKGTAVTLSGEYDIRKWETNNGEKREAHEFTVRNIQAHGAPKNGSQGAETYSEGKYPATGQAPAYESLSASDDLPF